MKVLVIVLTLAIVFAAPMAAIAETTHESVSRDPVTGAVRTVGMAALGTVETAVAPVKAVSEGDGDQVLSAPLEKGGQTVNQAAQNTGKTLTGQAVE